MNRRSLQITKTSLSERRQYSNASSGQIVVEYILLLIVAVSIAVLITSTMVSRNPETPGFLIVKWLDIIKTIGSDVVDQ